MTDTTPTPNPNHPWGSPTVGKIAEALAAAQAEMGHASKDSKNPHFKNDYASLASVIDASKPILNKHGISVMQLPQPDESGITLVTRLVHKSGEWISDGGLSLPASKQDAQGYGSCLTYARRYGLSAVAGIAQEDDDGNAAAASVNPQAARQQRDTTRQKATKAPTVSVDQAHTIAALSTGLSEAQPKVLLAKAKQVPADEFDAKVAELTEKLEAKGLNGTELLKAYFDAEKVPA